MSFQLATLFEAVADADPDREVLVSGERRLTYRDLEERSNRLAHVLSEAGIGEGDAVGLQLVNGPEYIEGMLAAFKIRAVPININYRYVERELRYLYDDSGLKALVYHRQFGPKVAAAVTDRSLAPLLAVDDSSSEEVVDGSTSYEEALAAASAERPDPSARTDDDLYMIYTGGTTGMPKGVVWRHEDIFKAAMGGGDMTQQGDFVADEKELAQRLPEQGPISLATPPLMHASAHWLVFHNLFVGGKAVLLPEGRFDPPTLWRTVKDEGVWVLVIIGDAMAKPLLDELEKNADSYDVSTLFVVASSGAALSDANKERIGKLIPNAMIVDSLGSSETGVLGAKSGKSFSLSDVTGVIDPDHGKVQPGSGTVGKVARRGHVPLRYHNDPEKTAATFVEIDGERWALTGDEATVEEDGTVKVLGRGSMCINTGGEKVYPEEVEEPLRNHPAIDDAIVVGVPDERWGETVVAVVSLEDGATIDLSELQTYAREHVAGYKVPRDLVVVDEILRSPAGKADYRWAKEQATAGRSSEQS